ncbi:biotin-dependent carboxyltransferase family protein [Palleronia rufa]|uniref:5-oxoprolinase subunit C family protein n=1 Tax=Palleronia rufa TaxID=1530186 RepID=UPI000568E6C8|nr:biotin-dependent carboxyltransferase family protein [Palleronia rufa]
MTGLTVARIGPGATVQDLGRGGYIAQGLSRGGAADRLAILEAAALLDQDPTAAIELPPVPATIRFDRPARLALTGTPMTARLDGDPLTWHAVHAVAQGQTLSVSPAGGGYGYLSFGGGIDTAIRLGSRAAHLAAGLGRALDSGDDLPLGDDTAGRTDRVLDAGARFAGGTLRILPSAHTALFSAKDIARFQDTAFVRAPQGNRQGVRLDHDGAPFATDGQLSLLSEIARPGDIQMTGEGRPYLLGPECQTTGGYPRIGAVVPMDLPRALQAPPGAALRFRFVTREEAMRDHLSDDRLLAALRGKVRRLTRDPRDIRDLGRYQLISGVTAGRPEGQEPDP